MPNHRVALLLSYHGSGFHGYQRQPGFATVQEEIEDAWLSITGEQVVAYGSGRTDSGVHAWGQVVHINTSTEIPPQNLVRALNTFLPEEAVVRECVSVDKEFHACNSATAKRYLYRIDNGKTRPVLQQGNLAWVRSELNFELMREAARHFLGEHDFEAFAAAGRSAKTTVRNIHSIHLWKSGRGLNVLVEGNGFLYKMVRNMVGSLIEVGKGRHHPDWIKAVLEGRDRRKAGPTAPPEGLYLWRVIYPNAPFNPC